MFTDEARASKWLKVINLFSYHYYYRLILNSMCLLPERPSERRQIDRQFHTLIFHDPDVGSIYAMPGIKLKGIPFFFLTNLELS